MIGKHRLISKLLIIIFTIFIAAHTQRISHAQSPFVGNIALADLNSLGGIEYEGSIVGDILYAEGMVFLYAIDEVIIYKATGDYNFIKTVALNNDPQNENEHYGKFSPLFFDTRKHVDDVQLMAYNSNSDVDILYVLGPDLRIYGIKVDSDPTNIVVEFVIDRPTDIDIDLAPLHGLVNLKYSNNRLYCVIEGRNNTKPTGYFTGMFHYRDVYISIYNMNPITGDVTQPIYGALYHLNDEEGDYDDAIMDIEINDQTFYTGGNPYNIFYLARNERVEIYKVSGSTVNHLDGLDINLNYYKVGKMLYINQNGINKLLVFPYRTPAGLYEPPLSTPVSFFEIDGGDPLGTNWGATNHQTAAPHKRILDAAFIPGQNDLVLAYSIDDLYNIDDAENTDIAIYSYDFNSNNFGDPTPQYLNTNGNTSSANPLSLNRPFKIHAKNDYFLLSKKDEIKKVYYDGTQYIESPVIYSSESNYFYSASNVGNTFYILNLAKNGFEVIINESHEASIQTGFQCLDIAHRPGDQKLFFYNRLNVYNNGFYIYDMPSGQVETFIDIEKPIGDVVYNPFQNHMLISENAIGESGAKINVVEGNEISEDDSFSLGSGTKYAKQMFIAPNGRLYIASNMRDETPKLTILDASDYSVLGSYTVSDIDLTDNYDIFNADFCYNPYNRKVYAIISANNTTVPGTAGSIEFSSFDPYFPLLNTTHEYNSGASIVYPAVLLEVNEAGLNTLLETGTSPIDNFSGPREVICSTPTNAPEGYQGKLFINAEKLIIYDCENDEVDETVDINLNDITYFPEQDMVYGFKDRAYIHSSQGVKTSWRVADVYSVDASGNLSASIYSYNGQLASIFANPYNNKLYLHSKVDETRLGVVPMSLIEIDPFDPLFEPNPIPLENKSHYVELDKNGDFHFHNYNLATPYIDPYQNRIFLPNGGHSNVSVVGFDPFEPLTLNPGGITWLSIPRHAENPANPTPIDDVFDPDNISGILNQIQIDFNNIHWDDPPGFNRIISSDWDEFQGWDIHIDNSHVYSTRGYIVEHFPDEQKTLGMQGLVESPDAGMDIYCKKDNWVGYFLYEEQSAFDALADVLDELYHIKGQDFNCYRYNYPISDQCGLKSEKDYSPGTWICNARPNIKYGDMIMVKPEEDTWFQWNYSGNQPGNLDIPAPEHFEFEEQATYTTLVLELDTTMPNPDEIGAFINDTCIGACTVNELDSVVVLSAYMYDEPGDSVTFQQHYASGKSTNAMINEYFVLNNRSNQKEKRAVRTGEKQDIFIISFRDEIINEEQIEAKELSLYVYPNPATSLVHTEYSLDQSTHVSIVLLDIMGKQMIELFNGHQQKGINTHSWNADNINGLALNKGVYLIQLTAGGKSRVQKLIVN